MANSTSFFSSGGKDIAILIDPDKFSSDRIVALKKAVEKFRPSYFFVGGSLLISGDLDETIQILKKHFNLPVLIFPGDHSQVSSHADGILFLTLLSGRNPEYLAGQQVKAAPAIKKSKISVIPVAYLLIDGGRITTVQYITQSIPLPADKPEIIISTALAGQFMGMHAVYLETGSGALRSVSPEIIAMVKKNIDIPLIVGGGIKSQEEIENLFEAGADVIVLGTIIEESFK